MLFRSVAVSTWQVVASRAIGAFIIHGVGYLAVVILLALWRGGIHAGWIAITLPHWIGLYVLALALAQITAICNVFARDTQQILTHLLTAWVFLTPILYVADLIPARFGWWLRINPMSDLIAGIRDPLLWGRAHEAWPWLTFVYIGLILLLSWLMHRRFPPYVTEFL